jgi:hypothetical protein
MFPILETSLKVLKLLVPGSGTRPDELPARILKECAEELALPITILVMRILAHGKWPNIWRVHWIIPLYKRAAVYKSKNYRGVHMTPQISKAVERVLKTMIEPHLEHIGALGDNQFAYRKGRGSRDLILMLMLEWMSILDRRGKIGVFCSDVAGAFDRVSAEILIAKLEMYGLHPRIVAVLKSWLEKRTACVLVGGERSELFDILNQIFQGTVLGPILWDVFFADVSLPIRTTRFKEVMFADDLNSYREYGGNAKNSTIAKHAKNCQTEVHTWGKAMQVEFETPHFQDLLTMCALYRILCTYLV